MKAFLILEDGTVFEGIHIGADKEIISEIVFNTSMAGYLEVLTNPSYTGQAVCMTYPLIGNYGVCDEDMESKKTWADGLIVRELSRIPSNFRCDRTLQEFLEANDITGIAGIDTRALTKLLRDKGTMNGCITTNEHIDKEEISRRLKEHNTGKVVEKVTCEEKYTVKGTVELEQNGPISGSSHFVAEEYNSGVREKKPTFVRELNGKGKKVALLDLGTTESTIAAFTQRGCDVMVYPAFTKAEEILAENPNGIIISNGPGNPKDCTGIIEEVKKLYDADVAIFAVGLGHQVMALATGNDTYKLPYGHRGGNYPIKDLATGRVYITSQSHGYAVDTNKLNANVAVPAFVNVNDGTNEGLTYFGKNILAIQFHPEVSAGPQDAGYLFDRFMKMMEVNANA